MAEEAVIFPSEPLFMVDRSWQRRGRKVSPSKDIENSSRVPEITITVLNGTSNPRRGTPRPPKSRLGSHHQPPKNVNVQFMNYHPQTTSKKRDARNKNEKAPAKNKLGVAEPLKSKDHSKGTFKDGRLADTPEHLSLFSRSIPKSNSPVYTVIDPEVSDFERFLTYYPTRLANAIYPLSEYLNFKYNTLAKIWLPAAVNDEVLLHTILFASALHLYSVSENHDFKDANLLMKVILDRLNRRLHTKTLSDATIGAVSCLAMCENTLGKHGKFAMHMSGMAEMVRVRGGMPAIRHELQMKIYRADIAGAVDTLSKPRLPPPTRTSSSLFETLNLKTAHRSPFEVMLANSGLTPELANLLEDLSQLSIAIEHAMETQTPLDPLLFDEETMCLQYDLLTAVSWNGQNLDNACGLAALIYLQTLTRAAPFVRSSSQALSLELEVSLLNLDMAKVPCPLMFWLLVMGGFVSAETSERSWFRRKLRECQVSWKDKISWESMKLQLMMVMWIDKVHDKYGKALWEDVIAPP